MIKDSKIIKDFLNYKYSHFDRQKYYRQLESTFKCINYGQEFLNNVETFFISTCKDSIFIESLWDEFS